MISDSVAFERNATLHRQNEAEAEKHSRFSNLRLLICAFCADFVAFNRQATDT